jgi:hypothetical protein
MKSKIAIGLLLLMSLNACSTSWRAPTDECTWTKKIVTGPRMVRGSTAHNEWRWNILRLADEMQNANDPAMAAQARSEIEISLQLEISILMPDLARQIADHNGTRGKICGTAKPID